MVQVSFNKRYFLHGTTYTKGQIAFIDSAWVPYLIEKKIIRLVERNDKDAAIFKKG